MIGKTIHQYKVLEKLGEGGMGVVYLAEDTKLKRQVAIKFLPAHISTNSGERKRFEIEAQAAAALNHPNIATIHNIEETEGELFLVMEYIEGHELKESIKEGLSIEEAKNYAFQIAEGLQAAHEKGIVHRDIKSSNIMVTSKGKIKIMDFGLAKFRGSVQLTQLGTTVGTTAYMSPEQARGEEADTRADIWSLGVVLYELFTGQLPFKGNYEQAVMYSIINEDPESARQVNPELSDILDRVIIKCLKKDREQRYQNIEQVLLDLTGQQTENLKNVPAPGLKAKPISHKNIVVAAVLVSLLSIFFILFNPFVQDEEVIAASRPLVVMPFENQTGDPSLDYLKAAIPNLLITNLEQSQYLNVLTWERMHDLLKQLGKDSIEVMNIDRETGFELCKLDGVHGIVLGSFIKAGETFVTDIKVLNVDDKKTLTSTNVRGTGVGSILDNQIDELSNNILQVVAVLPEQTTPQELRIADVSTMSMDAFRYYYDGVSRYNDVQKGLAEVSFQKALDFDSTFAMAWYNLSQVRRRLSNIKLANESLEKALKYSEKATEKERLYITMTYAQHVENDFPKAIKINEELVKKYPREKSAIFALGGKYQNSGRITEAIKIIEQGVTLDPSFRTGYNNLGYLYAAIKNYNKAEESLKLYIKFYPDIANSYDSLGELYWLWGRLDDAIRLNNKALEVDSTWLWSPMRNAMNYALKDNYPQALFYLDEVTRRNANQPETALKAHENYYTDWFRGICFWRLGRAKEAIASFSNAYKMAINRSNTIYKITQAETMARLYADIGEIGKAEESILKVQQIGIAELPADSLRWRLKYSIISGTFDALDGRLESAEAKLVKAKKILPKIRHETLEVDQYNLQLFEGELNLALGKVKEAITIFENTTLPNPFIATRYLDYTIPPRQDGLARAYYANGDLDKAIETYQRRTTFYPENGGYPVQPIMRYYLAKLYQEKGYPGLAIQEYEIFLERWKDADKGLAELIDARKQLTRLKESV